MEKKFYNAPEVKFHQLMAKTSMLAGSGGGEDYNGGKGNGNNNDDDNGSYFIGDDQELGAKGGYLNFDEN